jgi:hypothetical protein
LKKKAYPVRSGVFLLIGVFLFAACGIEDYPYLFPVPQGSIRQELNNRAVMSIPNANSGNAFFYNYTIYYRIYLSNNPIENSPSVGNFSAINSTLAQVIRQSPPISTAPPWGVRPWGLFSKTGDIGS